MKFQDAQIRATILEWILETKQDEMRYAIHFCLGFYGYITKQIMRVLDALASEGFLRW